MDLFDGVLEKTKNLISGVIPETGKMFSHYLGRDNGTFGKMLEEKYSAEPYRVKARGAPFR